MEKSDSRSFVAGTPVSTPTGLRSIESIEAGNVVDTTLGPQPVLQTMKTKRQAGMVLLSLNGETIICTDDHPFHVRGVGWMAVRDLQPGHVLTGQKADVVLASCPQRVRVANPQTIYNLSVKNARHYYVGQARVLTHT